MAVSFPSKSLRHYLAPAGPTPTGKEKRHNIHPSRIFKLFGASCEEAIWPGLKAQNMIAEPSELNLQI
jgi:hypothetical protein